METREKHDLMRELTLRSGVKPERFEIVAESFDSYQGFLDNVYENEYAEVVKVWNLRHMTPQIWDNYKLLKIGCLPELEMLEAAFANLRKAWNKNVHIKKNKEDNENKDQKVSSRTSVRPR